MLCFVVRRGKGPYICSLYAQGNILIRKLHMCSENVKVPLFKTFCSPMYTAHIWWNNRKCTIRKLYVAFNDVMRMLLDFPRYSSASLMFLNCRARDCRATIRNLIYRFIGRLAESENPLLHGLVDSANSDIMYTSGMWRHWYQELDVYFPVT